MDAYRDLQLLFLPPVDFIETGASEEEFNANINIYRGINRALTGEIDLDEAIELIEKDILYGDIDHYLDEVEKCLGIWAKKWKVNSLIWIPNN